MGLFDKETIMTEENIHEGDADVQAQPAPPAQPAQPTQPAPPAQSAQPAQSYDLNVYQTIIDQQKAQIDALMTQNAGLNSQITQMIQGQGVQINDGAHAQPPAQVPPMVTPAAPPELRAYSDTDDFSMEALGREIGKPRYEQ